MEFFTLYVQSKVGDTSNTKTLKRFRLFCRGQENFKIQSRGNKTLKCSNISNFISGEWIKEVLDLIKSQGAENGPKSWLLNLWTWKEFVFPSKEELGFFFVSMNFFNCWSKLEKWNAEREGVLTSSTFFVVLKHTTLPSFFLPIFGSQKK